MNDLSRLAFYMPVKFFVVPFSKWFNRIDVSKDIFFYPSSLGLGDIPNSIKEFF